MVRPPPYRGCQSDCEPKRSDHQALRSSFVTCFTDFGHPPCGAPTSVVPHVTPSTPPAPCATPMSMTPAAPPAPPTSSLYPLHYSRHPRAAWELPAPPLHQQSSTVKVVSVAPLINPHPMITRVKRGFRLPIDRLTLSTNSASTLSLVPSSLCVALVDPNWRCAMEEKFAALIANNTWDLVPRPVGSNVVTDK
jgi:hypothetical protein